MSNTNSYESPFCTRYASGEMQYIFSADKKFSTWRRLWVALARAEMKLGLPVTQKHLRQGMSRRKGYNSSRRNIMLCRR